jgi:hypothetical protein
MYVVIKLRSALLEAKSKASGACPVRTGRFDTFKRFQAGSGTRSCACQRVVLLCPDTAVHPGSSRPMLMLGPVHVLTCPQADKVGVPIDHI